MQKRALVRLVSGLALAALALSACGGGEEPESETQMQQVTYKATEFAFEGPSTFEAGLTSFTMDNVGKEDHMAGIMKLNPGVTLTQAIEAAKNAPNREAAIFQQASGQGGMQAVGPGQSSKVVQRVNAGNYVLFCFVPSPDGINHWVKGMVKEVTVEGTAPAANEPKSDGTIVMKDLTFELPDALMTGKGTFQVTNEGPQPHELQLMKLAPGKTAADFQAFAQAIASGTPPSGPPPFSAAGGFSVIPTDLHGWVIFDLEPGDYLAVCFTPDQAKGGIPHLAEGMITPFTVS